jgi:chemotaxis protein methyltransferase CheR
VADACVSEEGIDPALVAEYRTLLKERLGIHVEPSKEYVLLSRLGKIRRQGGDLPVLLGILKENEAIAERLLGRFFTTGHTFFFREREHFDFLASDAAARGLHSPKIWCAASSTGEEPYTIAISLLEAGIRDFTLLASDVNMDALRACDAGLYRPERLQGMRAELLDKYFTPDVLDRQSAFRVRPELRKRLTIKRLNLMDPLRFEGRFDYVFCRNVFIYFPLDSQERVLLTISRNLESEGRLFMGFSEPLLNFRGLFDQVAASVYKPSEASLRLYA